MCTVTILPGAVLDAARVQTSDRLRLRLACNRDELVSRAPALPPTTGKSGNRVTVMPVDPESGGTWIGANDSGLVCALLNVYDESPKRAAPLSRGTIIPPLLGCDDIEAALAHARQVPAERYRPFRLLIVDGQELAECWSMNGRLEHRRERLTGPVMRTSSGLGDAVAAGPRATLFRSFFDSASDPVAAEDLFHLHQWRGQEAISVRMRRPDACTVSHTVVEVRESSVRLVYRPASAADSVLVTVAG